MKKKFFSRVVSCLLIFSMILGNSAGIVFGESGQQNEIQIEMPLPIQEENLEVIEEQEVTEEVAGDLEIIETPPDALNEAEISAEEFSITSGEVTEPTIFLTEAVTGGVKIKGFNPEYLKTVAADTDEIKRVSIIIPEKINEKAVVEIASSAFSVSAQSMKGVKLTGVDFSGATQLKTIRSAGFYGQNELRGDLVFPNNIEVIENNVFDGCGYDGTLTLPTNPNFTTIKGQTFRCQFTGILEIPGTVTTIEGNYAFSKNNFTKIIFNEGLTKIGPSTFLECKGITTVTFPNTLKAIDQNAFKGCTALAQVSLNEGLETIGKAAFEECPFNSVIKLPSSVKSIEGNSFSKTGCKALYLSEGTILDKDARLFYGEGKKPVICKTKADYERIKTTIDIYDLKFLGYEASISFENSNEKSFDGLFNFPINYRKEATTEEWCEDLSYRLPDRGTPNPGRNNGWGFKSDDLVSLTEKNMIAGEVMVPIEGYVRPTFTQGKNINKAYDGKTSYLTVMAEHPLRKKVSEAKPGDIILQYRWIEIRDYKEAKESKAWDMDRFPVKNIGDSTPLDSDWYRLEVNTYILKEGNTAAVLYNDVFDYLEVDIHRIPQPRVEVNPSFGEDREAHQFTNLQDAMLVVADGGQIDIAEGSYTLTEPLAITKAVNLVGKDMEKVKILPDEKWNEGDTLISISAGDQSVTLKNLTIEGKKTATPQYGIKIEGSMNVALSNITAKSNKYSGLMINSSEVRAHNLYTSDNDGYGVNLDQITDESGGLFGSSFFELTYDEGVSPSEAMADKVQIYADHGRKEGYTIEVNLPSVFKRYSTGEEAFTWSARGMTNGIYIEKEGRKVYYSTIQNAINGAESGGTVYLGTESFGTGTANSPGRIEINKDITIEGKGATASVILDKIEVTGKSHLNLNNISIAPDYTEAVAYDSLHVVSAGNESVININNSIIEQKVSGINSESSGNTSNGIRVDSGAAVEINLSNSEIKMNTGEAAHNRGIQINGVGSKLTMDNAKISNDTEGSAPYVWGVQVNGAAVTMKNNSEINVTGYGLRSGSKNPIFDIQDSRITSRGNREVIGEENIFYGGIAIDFQTGQEGKLTIKNSEITAGSGEDQTVRALSFLSSENTVVLIENSQIFSTGEGIAVQNASDNIKIDMVNSKLTADYGAGVTLMGYNASLNLKSGSKIRANNKSNRTEEDYAFYMSRNAKVSVDKTSVIEAPNGTGIFFENYYTKVNPEGNSANKFNEAYYGDAQKAGITLDGTLYAKTGMHQSETCGSGQYGPYASGDKQDAGPIKITLGSTAKIYALDKGFEFNSAYVTTGAAEISVHEKARAYAPVLAVKGEAAVTDITQLNKMKHYKIESPYTYTAEGGVVLKEADIINKASDEKYLTIQEALDNAYGNDVIYVPGGTYPEDIKISKAIKLVGANEGISGNTLERNEETILKGSIVFDNTKTIRGALIDGFKLTDKAYIQGTYWAGTLIKPKLSDLVIQNNVFENLDTVNGGKNTAAIHLNCGDDQGINNIVVQNNRFANVGSTSEGGEIAAFYANSFSGKLQIVNNIIDGTTGNALTIVGANNKSEVNITGNTLSNWTNRGIRLDNLKNSKVSVVQNSFTPKTQPGDEQQIIKATNTGTEDIQGDHNYWGSENPVFLRNGTDPSVIEGNINTYPYYKAKEMAEEDLVEAPAIVNDQNGNTKGMYGTIQEAIDAESTVNGDTIQLAKGNFDIVTQINLNKALTLKGTKDENGTPLTSITNKLKNETSSNAYYALNMNVSNSTLTFNDLNFVEETNQGSLVCNANEGLTLILENLRFSGTKEQGTGIKLGQKALKALTIKNSSFTGLKNGIYSGTALITETVIENTEFKENELGIYLKKAKNVKVSDSKFIDNVGDRGLSLEVGEEDSNISIINSTFIGNGTKGFIRSDEKLSAAGILIKDGDNAVKDLTITGNTITGNATAGLVIITKNEITGTVDISQNKIHSNAPTEAQKLAEAAYKEVNNGAEYYNNGQGDLYFRGLENSKLKAINNYWGTVVPDFKTILSGNVNVYPYYVNETMVEDTLYAPVELKNGSEEETTYFGTINDAYKMAEDKETIIVNRGADGSDATVNEAINMNVVKSEKVITVDLQLEGSTTFKEGITGTSKGKLVLSRTKDSDQKTIATFEKEVNDFVAVDVLNFDALKAPEIKAPINETNNQSFISKTGVLNISTDETTRTWTYSSPTNNFNGGDGTENNPYQINTADQLRLLTKAGFDTSSKYFKLTNDITVTDWVALAEFKGSLEGNGYSITGNNVSFVTTLEREAKIEKLRFEGFSHLVDTNNGVVDNVYTLSGNPIINQQRGELKNSFTNGNVLINEKYGTVVNSYYQGTGASDKSGEGKTLGEMKNARFGILLNEKQSGLPWFYDMNDSYPVLQKNGETKKIEGIEVTVSTQEAQVGVVRIEGNPDKKIYTNDSIQLVATINGNMASKWTFDGWYQGETKISETMTTTQKVTEATEFIAKFTLKHTKVVTLVPIGITEFKTVQFEGVTPGDSIVQQQSFAIGERVTIKALPPEGYRFSYWTSNGATPISYEASYSFTLGVDNSTYMATFEKVKAEEYQVKFLDTTGTLIVMESSNQSSGYKVKAPISRTVVGKEFIGWYDEETKIEFDSTTQFSVNEIKKDCDLKARYKDIEVPAEYTLEVINGSYSPVKETYAYNERVTLTANPPEEGKNFGGWVITGTETIVSYNTVYSFNIAGNTSFTATYADKPVEVKPTVSMDTAVTQIEQGVGFPDLYKLSFVGRIKVPSEYTPIECGIVVKKSEVTEASDIEIGKADVIKGKASVVKPEHQYAIAVGKLEDGKKVSARAYLIYSDKDGNSHTIYSNMVVGTVSGS